MSPKIVTIGGGTGQFTVLSGLSKTDANLTAIVSMVDDGGSTGILRDELGALPPGDVRQCLVALSHSSDIMRKLFNYRFEQGGLRGHNVGNLLITSLEKITGSFDEAVEETSKILGIRGRVVPVTTKDTVLCLKTKSGKIIRGQHKIDNSFFERHRNFVKLFLKPEARINPKAEKAIKDADIVVIGPGSYYTSVVPNLLVGGVCDAIRKSHATKIFVANLVNKKGQTDNFTVDDYVKDMERIIGSEVFNWVIYNNKRPTNSMLRKYREEGGNLVLFDKKRDYSYKTYGTDLISKKDPAGLKHDIIERNLIRHNEAKLARIIYKIYEESKTSRKHTRGLGEKKA